MKLDDMRSRRGPIMLGYLRKGFYQDSSRMLELLDTLGIEMDGVWGTFNDILDQCFVDRATWGLDIWEKELGLVPGPSDSDEIRRARIKAKLIGFGTFTEQIAQELANAYSRSGEARYLPLYDKYSFKTQYEDDDLISYAGLKAAFEEARPAHLFPIVGLINELLFPFHVQASTTVKSDMKLDYSGKIGGGSVLKGRCLYLGFTRYEVDDIEALVFNGAWQFDGTQSFSGMNQLGIDLYLNSADLCSLRHIREGQVIDEEVF